ncbi:MAG: hypothetical protein M9921_14040 [Fimbriimonadaceae bacterium]|nr:hypothetical protein [Chthonomonadaceae bacterium]MCO5297965.1 hypothetical protein [Fimbriimonadaceae bacterium]
MIGQQAAARVARGANVAWLWLRRMPNRLRVASLDMRDAAQRARAASAAPTPSERFEQLRGFYDRYNLLVETLCDSAQYGPTAKLEGEYASHRKWMLSNYPAIRKYVVAYLRFDSADTRQGLDLHGQSADAFEALFCASSLDEFLRADDGQMIERLQRTRESLIHYGDHLRSLVRRESGCA